MLRRWEKLKSDSLDFVDDQLVTIIPVAIKKLFKQMISLKKYGIFYRENAENDC